MKTTKPTISKADELQTKVMAILDKAKLQAFKPGSTYSTNEGKYWSYMIKSEAVEELAKYIVDQQRQLLDRVLEQAWTMPRGRQVVDVSVIKDIREGLGRG